MAREYGRIMSAIWRDQEWRALSVAQQHAYLMFISMANISSAGVLALTIRRWAECAGDSDADSLSKAITELVSKRYIAYDDQTEELFVRSFIKWDHGYTNPKRIPAILSDAHAVQSQHLRALLAVELDAVGLAHSLVDSHTDSDTDSHADTPLDLNLVPNPEPDPVATKPSTASRGARLPSDWQPTEADLVWQRGERITATAARRETEKFRNHFQAATGANAVKRDWSAAWKNWIMRAIDGPKPVAPASTQTHGGW